MSILPKKLFFSLLPLIASFLNVLLLTRKSVSSGISLAFLKFRELGWARSMALNELVDDIVGNIYLDLGKRHEELVPFLASDRVRNRWLAAIVHKAVIDSVSTASTEVI